MIPQILIPVLIDFQWFSRQLRLDKNLFSQDSLDQDSLDQDSLDQDSLD